MPSGPIRSSKGKDALRDQIAALHPAAYAWALSCCRRETHHAEEVLQESYRKIAAGKATYEGRSTFKTWLFSVIRFTAREHRRRLMFRQIGLARFRWEATPTYPTMPDAGAHTGERNRVLGEALATLANRQREVLHLVFYEDQTLQEASETLRISIGSTRQHYHRGKERLRAILQDKGITL